MPEREHPAMQAVKASKVRENWSQMLNEVARKKTRLLVEKSGIPVAVLLSVDEFTRLSRLEAEREERFAVIKQARAAFKDVPDKELAAQVTRAVAEARAELQAEREQAVNVP